MTLERGKLRACLGQWGEKELVVTGGRVKGGSHSMEHSLVKARQVAVDTDHLTTSLTFTSDQTQPVGAYPLWVMTYSLSLQQITAFSPPTCSFWLSCETLFSTTTTLLCYLGCVSVAPTPSTCLSRHALRSSSLCPATPAMHSIYAVCCSHACIANLVFRLCLLSQYTIITGVPGSLTCKPTLSVG